MKDCPEWMQPSNVKQVKVDDGEPIAVWDSESGDDVVIFVHGFPENHFCWTQVIASLSKENSRRFVVYDLRGHGDSSKKGEASWQRFTQDHLNIIEHFGFNRYRLVGHDWGGAIGLHISRIHPEHLKSLAVMNTNFWKTDLKGMWHLTFLNLPIVAPAAFRFFPEKIYKLFLNNTFLNPASVPDSIRSSYLERFKDPDTTQFWIRLYKSMARALLGQMSPKAIKKKIIGSKVKLPRSSKTPFNVPTTLIWGKQDTFNPLWVGHDIESRLKNAGCQVQFHEVDNAAHFVAEEQPDQVAKLLVSHWNQSK